MDKIEKLKLFIMDSLNDVNEALEHFPEDIDVEASEKHRDFCEEILDMIEWDNFKPRGWQTPWGWTQNSGLQMNQFQK